MKLLNKSKILFLLVAIIILILVTFFILAGESFDLENSEIYSFFVNRNDISLGEKLKNPPSSLRGIYMTSWTAGTPSLFNNLLNLIEETELNAVVLDVKDYSGYLSFRTSIPLAEEIKAHDELRIVDIQKVIRDLHDRNIYVIGRLQVFQDPLLALARPDLAVRDSVTREPWRDHKNLSWLDPAGQEVRQYALEIAREADRYGFDEINFDYVRFPSDGNLERMVFPFWDNVTPRYEVVRSFFQFLREETLKEDIKISADIFGMASWRAMDLDYDAYIGQRMTDALPYFDAVMPMIYPSHFAPGTVGFENPADHPYEIVYESLKRTKQLMATTTNCVASIRPWIQDFDIGANYGPEEVRAQIRATYDNGIKGWVLWNASNKYTREALLEN